MNHFRSALQCVAVRCSVLQCVAVRCSALQCVAVRCTYASVAVCSLKFFLRSSVFFFLQHSCAVKCLERNRHNLKRPTKKMSQSHRLKVFLTLHRREDLRVLLIRNPNVKRKQRRLQSFLFGPIELQTATAKYTKRSLLSVLFTLLSSR